MGAVPRMRGRLRASRAAPPRAAAAVDRPAAVRARRRSAHPAEAAGRGADKVAVTARAGRAEFGPRSHHSVELIACHPWE